MGQGNRCLDPSRTINTRNAVVGPGPLPGMPAIINLLCSTTKHVRYLRSARCVYIG
jgi:hypothetical protein